MVYDQLAEPLPAVCANGAVVYDPVTDEVLRADPLAPQLLAEVARRLRAEVPGVSFAVEIAGRPGDAARGALPAALGRRRTTASGPIETPEELLSVPAVKLLARAGEQDPDAFVRAGRARRWRGWPRRRTRRTRGWWRSPRPGSPRRPGWPGTATGSASAAADVLAFGDMPNDVPMLDLGRAGGGGGQRAPRRPGGRRRGDAANNEDGVAAYLEKVFGVD